ncbi:MAG: 2-amino-4-hydroxy-6-hydroxymethyldihydropteridine diphosphokinase [Pontiellaceae bacterium]|jgi:2-amino-4-hydroxy-6-hydroxymethyldihydropteridine diphosphokinase|nr:2-amino-4-hydroxy-6-hydroxymethyldihydropteridine diphosphokinase [Pontiellaceae bacterium]
MSALETGFCLGSNLGERLRLLSQAKTRILLEPEVKFMDQSAVYETEPVDVKSDVQHMKFLNAVLIVESPYTAEEWLPKIKKIETVLHRVRTDDRNAPRTIDVDILFCGRQTVKNDRLEVPHPRWAERRFVVQPLADVRPELVLPGTEKSVRNILEQLSDSNDVRLFSATW